MKNSTISTALAAAIDHGDREVQVAQREEGGPDRRDQEEQERDEHRDIGPDGRDVLAHECTSIK